MKILKKFYYTFIDYGEFPQIKLQYCWLHLRDSLTKEKEVFVKEDWEGFLQQVNNMIPLCETRKLYLIVSQGWVYEGKTKEIFDVLVETDCFLEDFYIVSPDFDWMIVYCGDGEYAALYRR